MSYQFNLRPEQRKAGRFISKVRGEIQKAYSEEKAAGKINQSKLAQKLGVSRSVVSRRIRGLQNLTLRSIAELAWALDREIVFELRKPIVSRGSNSVETATTAVIAPTGQSEPVAISSRKLTEAA